MCKYLRKFYRRFMESEAGHYTLFIDLAETYIDVKTVRKSQPLVKAEM